MTKSRRITNSQMRRFVEARQPFFNSKRSAYGELYQAREEALASVPPRYVVYSYGNHFPMYVYDYQMQEWYGNRDRYSVTTSRHQTQACPFGIRDWFDTDTMRILATQGFMGMMEALTRDNP